MFFNSQNFKTIEAGAQMTWMQQQTHIQNLGNIETPGYKAKKVEFKQVLESAESGSPAQLTSIHGEIVTDETASTRPDGNNVNFETENLELYKAYTQYTMLLDKISGKFDSYSYILNSNMK